MFAETQMILTNAFNFVAVAGLVWIATEYLYFSVAYDHSPQDEPVDEPEAVVAPEPQDEPEPVAPEPVDEPDLTGMPVVALRKLAIQRGLKGAGRWKRDELMTALAG